MTVSTHEIGRVATALFETNAELIAERGLTLIGLAVSNLAVPGELQLALPFAPRLQRPLDDAVDGIRGRCGNGAITRATLLEHNGLVHSFGEQLVEVTAADGSTG